VCLTNCISPCCAYYTGESSCEVKTEADSSNHTEHSHDDKPRPYLCAVKNSLNVRQQTGENCYSCTQCKRRYSSRCALYNHMYIHRGKCKYTECGRCCGCEQALAAHRLCCGSTCKLDKAVHRRIRSAEKPFECTVCSKRFSTPYNLMVHSRIHSGEKPYKCYVCDKTFSHSGTLKNHLWVHAGDNPYRCGVCDKAFRVSGNLIVHKRIHTGERPYTCSLCNKSFIDSSHLQQHKHCVHSSTTDELKQDENV